ncbi:MAG: protease inhibitor Inh [Xanthobacteraceae bacterium]|nr:protease inhibitor Inh [Xanthobacteraceae bacterium]
MTKKTSGAAALAVLALAVTGCAADRVSDRVYPAPGARAAAASGAPAVDVGGRWTLASAGGGSCAVTLSGAPGAAEGSIKPEGGCPGKLFTSRKWSLQQGALVIQDHTGAQLAQLAMSSPAQFAGTAGGGQQLTLSR